MGLWESSLAPPQFGDNRSYTDLLTFAFGGPRPYNEHRPLFIDAEHPSCSLNALQFRLLVRTLIAGLKAHQVQKGDCVLVHMGNSVSHPTFRKQHLLHRVFIPTTSDLPGTSFSFFFIFSSFYFFIFFFCISFFTFFFFFPLYFNFIHCPSTNTDSLHAVDPIPRPFLQYYRCWRCVHGLECPQSAPRIRPHP